MRSVTIQNCTEGTAREKSGRKFYRFSFHYKMHQAFPDVPACGTPDRAMSFFVNNPITRPAPALWQRNWPGNILRHVPIAHA
jgi:hypothetical protein